MGSSDGNTVGKRILFIQKELGLNSRQFAISLEIDPSQMSKIEKDKLGLSKGAAESISRVYNIPIEWLMYGKGVWKNVPHETSYVQKRNHHKNTSERKIPLFDAPAAAGLAETEMTPVSAPAGTIDVGDLLHDSQAAIRIYGNSMIPNYPPGCVVGLAKCSSKFIEPGEVYVIETRDRRILKRLFYKDDDQDSDFLMCYSDNTMVFEGGVRNGKPAYPPFNLPKDEIVNIFTVTGVIKRNANSVIINRK